MLIYSSIGEDNYNFTCGFRASSNALLIVGLVYMNAELDNHHPVQKMVIKNGGLNRFCLMVIH